MSTKAASPAAKLLRSSRIFSLPRPLSHSNNDLTGHIPQDRVSESATPSYPVRQAIATTPSALSRGDWGLKRPLPLRSTTHTTHPVLRINAIDTWEHITDFESASDLTLTLKKIHELNLPVTIEPRAQLKDKGRRKSPFDSNLDNTAAEGLSASGDATRWKFKGPWLAGMTPGDFETYVTKELKNRKAEFAAFLREKGKRELMSEQRAAARERGEPADEEQTISEEEIAGYIRRLRNNFNLMSPLVGFIAEFLDLPTLPTSSFVGLSNAAEAGPPRTHPSAGISYLRSDAFLDNHPILGPQNDRAPLEGRVLSNVVTTYMPTSLSGKVGVAGVVVPTPKGSTNRVRSIPDMPDDLDPLEVNDRASKSIGVGTPGGNRIWVNAVSMGVDSKGKIQIEVANPTMTTVGVHTGKLVAPDLPPAPKRAQLHPPGTRRKIQSQKDSNTGSQNYGVNERVSSQDRSHGLLTMLEQNLKLSRRSNVGKREEDT